MSIYSADIFTPDGRLRGSYVYMLLCQIDVAIHIKVGRSCNPLARLNELRTGCPVAPQVISVAEVHSHRKAVRVESDLHAALDRWHSHLEWFTVLPTERAEFNAAWKPVIVAHSSPSRRIAWRNYSVADVIAAAKRRLQNRQNNFMGRNAKV